MRIMKHNQCSQIINAGMPHTKITNRKAVLEISRSEAKSGWSGSRSATRHWMRTRMAWCWTGTCPVWWWTPRFWPRWATNPQTAAWQSSQHNVVTISHSFWVFPICDPILALTLWNTTDAQAPRDSRSGAIQRRLLWRPILCEPIDFWFWAWDCLFWMIWAMWHWSFGTLCSVVLSELARWPSLWHSSFN